MNSQLQLFGAKAEQARARRADPETSREGARAVCARGLVAAILQALDAHPGGLTIAEIAMVTERKEVSVSPRMTGMVAEELIEDSGVRRKNRDSRVEAIVWRRRGGR